jgi:excisionase family DNA binding protein
MPVDGDILTARDVAKLLKISRAMVYRLRSQGRCIPSYKLFDGERGWRWSRTDVEAYLRSVTVSESCVTFPASTAREVTLIRVNGRPSSSPYIRTKDRTAKEKTY